MPYAKNRRETCGLALATTPSLIRLYFYAFLLKPESLSTHIIIKYGDIRFLYLKPLVSLKESNISQLTERE